MSVSKDSPEGSQLLDTINHLKLELTRLEFEHQSPQTDIIKLQESIAVKRTMIAKVDDKIKDWKGTLDVLIPKLYIFKERSFRSDRHQEFKIKDANDILPYLSSIETNESRHLMDQTDFSDSEWPQIVQISLWYCLMTDRLGTWRLADVNESADELLKRVKHCMELGITTFDCADIYGGIEHVCEALLGKALALAPELRARMEIVTKCGIVCPSDSVNIKHYDLSKNYILTRVNESLMALGTDYIDLLLIHRPSCMMDADEVSAAFRELKESGKVRQFGVSNFKPFQLALLQSRLDFPLVTNQIELNPLCLDALHDGTLDQAQELKMSPMIWSPLAGGRLFSKDGDEKSSRVQKVLKSLAARYNVSVDQLIFSWILKHPSKPVIVLGTNKIDRITSAAGAFDCQLSTEDWFSVWEASNGACVP